MCAAAVAGGFSFSVLAFCRLFWVLSCLLCSTSLPRGNQVDGLPRAVHLKSDDMYDAFHIRFFLRSHSCFNFSRVHKSKYTMVLSIKKQPIVQLINEHLVDYPTPSNLTLF